MIKFDFNSYTKKYLYNKDYSKQITKIRNDFLENGKMKGWYELNNTEDELKEIETMANYIKKEADIFIIIGIGGSYLGSKAVIEALTPYFNKKKPEIVFAGYNLSSNYLSELLEYIHDKRIIVNVISKSGNTIEPNIAFEKIYEYMKTKYSDFELKNRIIVTTDSNKSKLLDFANNIGCKKFSIPSNVGGRFSVLTPVGLLPICVSGINIRELLRGALSSKENLNISYEYAKIRDMFYNSGRIIESFVVYEEKLYYFTEWLKQLFGETQGKNNKSLFPTSIVNTRDLHSLGQYLQEGKNIIFETNLFVEKKEKVFINSYNKNLDEIESDALKSVCASHYNGHTPSILITIDKLDEYNIGYLIFFFFISSMIGAYLLDVNYHDQPGVNGYKKILEEKLNNK